MIHKFMYLFASSNHSESGWAALRAVTEVVDDLSREEGDIMGQLELLESRGKKRRRHVDVWLDKVKELKIKASHLINYSSDDDSLDDLLQQLELIKEVRKHKEQKPVVLSNEFVGQNFEEHVKEMWKLLGDDRVFIIGIHGMGGVGKTCLATHMENEIKRAGTFKHVFWVTVSNNYSILKLQHEIAERIGIKLNGVDERTRAANLSLALMKTREKTVVILDDVWEYIDVQKVGIPFGLNGNKLILTHVCHQMDCLPHSIIRMRPLYDIKECWELFLLKLGNHRTPATLPPKVIEIAKLIVMECEGLPLGISVMARTMKGVNDIGEWRHELKNLKNLEMGQEMEQEVFKVLKLSFDNLKDKCMQDCFLHCALFGPVYDRVSLIMSLVEHGKINGRRSLKEIFDEGHTILNKLECHSLLEDDDVIMTCRRKMACHIIMKESDKYMIKCVTWIPDMQEWTSELEFVSLDCRRIEEIPESTSPYCPRLSTLILRKIKSIPESFFTRMDALTILDLSYNNQLTCLPDSLFNLTSLISLQLRKCFNLKKVPSLEKLQALSRLDISCTSVEEIQGLEMLINLKWLDLSKNKGLRLILGLQSLTNLQYLDLRFGGSVKVKVKVGDDMQGMAVLECFGGTFQDC